MSTIVTSDAGGAVLLPAELWQAAGVAPGTDLVAEVAEGRIVLQQRRPSLAEDIAALARSVPQDVWDRLPEDGASRHDYYIEQQCRTILFPGP